MHDEITSLQTALDLCADVVARVPDVARGAPTPCAGWDVRSLVDHLHEGTGWFVTALGGRVDDDADLAGAQDALVAAFAAPGALDRTVEVPIGPVPASIALHLRTVEGLVHGWDVAVATGQTLAAPPDLVEGEIAFSRMALRMLPPDAAPFADPVPVADDAPPLDRLVALLGRDPAWTPLTV